MLGAVGPRHPVDIVDVPWRVAEEGVHDTGADSEENDKHQNAEGECHDISCLRVSRLRGYRADRPQNRLHLRTGTTRRMYSKRLVLMGRLKATKATVIESDTC